MWKANVTIIFGDDSKTFKYIYPHLYKYSTLYYSLDKIIKEELYIDAFNIKNYIIQFYCNYLGKDVLVNNWNKYILNNDIITIKINKDTRITYSLHDSYNNKELFKSYELKDVYKYCKNVEYHDFALIIYKKCKDFSTKYILIDVIENGEYYLDKLIKFV